MHDGDLDHEVVVVGAGPSGIASAIKLKEAGITSFVVLDREDGVGGTWYSQRYPGLTVDIPALTYSFSFEQRADWSSLWAPQAEVLDYCRTCVQKYGVEDHFELRREVIDATYDTESNRWTVGLADGGRIVARYLINASGYLSQSKWPVIPGLDGFEGTKIHSSRWSDDLDLDGKRVAMIGTGATAIQLAPQLADSVESLSVFQRTPIWLLPKPPMRLRPIVQQAFKRIPGLQRAARLGTAAFMDLVFFQVFNRYDRMGWFGRLAEKLGRHHIRSSVDDAKTAQELTPDYSWGCKRPSFSSTFYPMFNKPQVELVTAPIDSVTAGGIATADGQHRDFDAIICATGFQPFERSALPTYPVRGRDGTELTDYWEENRYQAYRGFTVHGFPNFFLVFGPYSTPSSSYIAGVELGVRSAVSCLVAARERGADYIEVREEVQRAEFEEIQRRKAPAIWSLANCGGSNAYYIDRHGDTPTFRPWSHPTTWRATKWPDLDAFEMRSHRPAPAEAAA